ncbi:MAG: hypothetical protein R2865_14665 [Deinococcales bacterium]
MIDGVELRRMGQAAHRTCHPIHFHLLSYNPDNGQFLGDSAQVVSRSSIWNSQNRCIVIHGSNGITLNNNICYDIKGHAIFWKMQLKG